MRIIIAGAGELGIYLANILSNEHQDVVVLDSDAGALEYIDNTCNVMTCNGNPNDLSTLREVKAGESGLFIAVTPNDAENILACSLAKSLGSDRTIAKVNHFHFMQPESQARFREMGVDHLAHYDYLAALEAASYLRYPWAKSRVELFGGELIVAGVKISAQAPLVGMYLKEFSKRNDSFHVAAIVRGSDTIIPGGDDRLTAGDTIYFTVARNDVEKLRWFGGEDSTKVGRVNLMGGSEIALRLVDLPQTCDIKFKLIEKEEEKCLDVENAGFGGEIIKGDARKLEVMAYAGPAEVFMAMSKSDEVNIMACVTAKRNGIDHTIAVVEDIQNISLAESFAVDKVINRKLVAANYIFRVLLSNHEEYPRSIALADAVIMEIKVEPGAPVTKGVVKKLKLPREITLAGMIRDGRGYLIDGDTLIRDNDRVVVACKAGSILKVKKLFL